MGGNLVFVTTKIDISKVRRFARKKLKHFGESLLQYCKFGRISAKPITQREGRERGVPECEKDNFTSSIEGT
jgi:hypothetical protein